MRRYDDTRALAVCREALRRGHLTHDQMAWRFGRRCFAFHIVRALIDNGEAVRDGNTVRAR